MASLKRFREHGQGLLISAPSVTRLENAGHYLQEDAHELIAPELVSFVNSL